MALIIASLVDSDESGKSYGTSQTVPPTGLLDRLNDVAKHLSDDVRRIDDIRRENASAIYRHAARLLQCTVRPDSRQLQ